MKTKIRSLLCGIGLLAVIAGSPALAADKTIGFSMPDLASSFWISVTYGVEEQAKAVEEQLGELLARVEEKFGPQTGEDDDDDDDEGFQPEPPEEEQMSPAARERIERLFTEAAKDRSKAFELKRELDRLGLFKDYENRFLDLFKKTS